MAVNEVYKIDLSALNKAYDRFKEFSQNLNTDQEKAGAIQAFEFTFEVAWKTMKRILSVKGIDTRSPRDTFREAALNSLIDAPNTWFTFIELRNISSHTYNENNVESVVQNFSLFRSEMDKFMENLGKLK